MADNKNSSPTNDNQNSTGGCGSWLIPLAFFFGYKMVQLTQVDARAEKICKPVPAYQKQDCLSCVKQGKIFTYDPNNRFSKMNTSCSYK